MNSVSIKLSQVPRLVAFRLGAASTFTEKRMNLPQTSELEIQTLGGELLDGSGFESEDPATGFEPDERAEEGLLP